MDPPPIVQLRIFEGENNEDITLPYNAGLFLFATLEPARAVAQGRVQQAQTNQPVLTGTPVAGISYLDRPQPAGYFIFPDLSVRHEGQYRLTFTLFEELKEPRDADANASNENVAANIHRRCEVKSNPFHVYSAKKFPGLTESTLLSRLVADQGCRVRIRRDVRVRRGRETKQEEGCDNPDDEPTNSGSHPDMTSPSYDNKHSPQQTSEQLVGSESSSTATLPAPPPNPAESQQSPAGYPYQWHQYSQTGHQSHQQAYSQQPQPDQSYAQQYQTQYSPNQPQPLTQYAQYAPAYGYQQSGPSPMIPNPTYAYVPQQQQQPMQPLYAQQQDISSVSQLRSHHQQQQHNMYSSLYDRDAQSSMQHYDPTYQQQQQQQQQQTVDPSSQQPTSATSQSHAPLSSGKPFPPMEVPRVSHTADALGPATTTAPSTQPTVGGRAVAPLGPPPTSQPYRPPLPQYISSTSAAGTKRSYGASFDTSHTEEALRNGARPNVDHVPDWSDHSEEDLQDLDSIRMTYRRADGSFTVVSPRRSWVA